MDNLITLTIDGRTVRVPRGTLVVEAARSVGITIPVFCYHHQLKPVGACRMCMVQITPGPPLPQTACTSPVAEGMVVLTRSEVALSAQRSTIEFLLLNHPLDCPVCDRGGECPLQDNTFGFGGAESRYIEEKRHFEKPLALSDEVLLDRERCIMCYRCVRFTREIAGDESLTVIERGTESQIGLAPGRTFDSPFSGNTIEICPVGALTSTRYRFAARPWDIKSVATICPHCAVGCNVRADVRDHEIKRFLSRENTGVDDGWLCDRGRFGYAFPTASNRLTHPMVRKNGQLVTATWTEALEVARNGLASVLDQHGGNAIGGIAGTSLTNEDLFLFQRMLREGLRSQNVDHTTDVHPKLPPGFTSSTGSISSLERSDVIILVGVNPIERQPVLDLRLKKAVNRGVKLVFIGDEKTDLAGLSNAFLKSRHGEESAVIKALLALIPAAMDAANDARHKAALAAAERAFAESVKKAHDAAVAVAKERNEPEPLPSASIEDDAARYGLTRPTVAPLPPSRVKGREVLLQQLAAMDADTRAAATGIKATDIARAAGVIGGGERVSILYPRSRGVDIDFLFAVTNLGLMTHAFGRDGAAIFPLIDETNHQGAIDLKVSPQDSDAIAGADMLGAATDGRLKAMYVAGRDIATDPAAVEALSKLTFLIVQDTTLTATAALAHVVFPGATFAEKDGTYTNLERRIQRLRQAIPVQGDARPDWRIFRDFLNSFGGQTFVNSAEEVMREIAANVADYAGVTYGRVGFKGVQWPYPKPDGAGTRFLHGDQTMTFELLPLVRA